MKKISLFKMFSGDGLGVAKDDKYNETPTNFAGFFVMLKRKFWNLSSLNLLYALCNFPVFFYLYVLTNQLHQKVTVVANPMLAAYNGLELAAGDKGALPMIYPFVSSYGVDFVNTTYVYIFLGISALFFITFGLANTGSAYIVRGYTRGDPIFLFSDFFGCIKRNIKQCIVIGVLDILFAVVLVWDITFWMSQSGFLNSVFMYLSVFLALIYFMARFYMYTIMITFKLSIPKIIKNSFLLAILGFKRNVLAFFGIFILFYLSLQIFFMIPSMGIMLPIIITFSLGMFMTSYASYPVIKKYMIDPFYNDEQVQDEDDDDPIFEDRG